MHLLDGGFSAAAHFQLQASGTYPADFHPRAFALIDLETYHSAYMGKQHLKEELEAQIADSHPFLYKGYNVDFAGGVFTPGYNFCSFPSAKSFMAGILFTF